MFTLVLSCVSWMNCIGGGACNPHTYFEPISQEMLCQCVTSTHSTIRVAGNGYSINDSVHTNDCLINLKHLNHVLSVDLNTLQVRVEAGITLTDLCAQLAVCGLALPNLPAITDITLGGAISTGAHGTGHTGTLSTFAVEIELVTADGTIHILSAKKDPEAFSAAGVSLGCLGVIYAATLQCEPLFYLKECNRMLAIDDFSQCYSQLVYKNDFVQATYDAKNNVISITIWNRCPKMEGMPYHQVLPWYTMIQGDQDLFSEIAIPINKLTEALNVIKQLVTEYSEYDVRIEPIGIRFVNQDKNSYLSPTFDGAKAYLAFSLSDEAKFLQLYQGFEEAMLRFNGRPHWGKLHFLSEEKVHNLYGSNVDRFLAIRSRLDPLHTFSNKFIDRLFNCDK